MVVCTCKRCGYSTTIKSNLISHLRRKNACPASLEDLDRNTLILELQPVKDTEKGQYQCRFCDKGFSKSQNRWRHESNKHKNVEDNNIVALTEKVEKLTQIIDEMKSHPPPNNVNNGIQVVNIQNNMSPSVQLKDFGFENMQAIGGDILISCFSDLKFRELLENLHYDPDYPENNNIRMKSVKRNMLEIYKNKQWSVITLSEGLNELILQATTIFKEYATKYHNRILEEEMSAEDFREIMAQLNDIMNKKYSTLISKDLQAMLETSKSAVTVTS